MDVTTTTIKATTRCAVELKGSWYTFEATEERSINNPENVNVDEEWDKLFDTVNNVVDEQVGDLIENLKSSR